MPNILVSKPVSSKTTVSRTTTPIRKETSEEVEFECLFGDHVDHFEKLQTCRTLSCVFHHAGPQNVDDDDIWDTSASLLKRSEIQRMLKEAFPNQTQRDAFVEENVSSYRRRHNGNAALLEAIYADPANRKLLWTMLAEAMDTRVSEYQAIVSKRGFTPRAFQTRIVQLQQCLCLDDTERDIVIVLFLEETGRLKLGDFSVSPYRSRLDISKLAIAVGVDEGTLAPYFSEQANLRRFSLIDEDGDFNRSFLSFLVGTSAEPLSERFWTRATGEALPWEYYGKLAEANGKVIAEMVESKPAENGLSILLYGAAGTGKTSFACSLGAVLGKEVYFIAQNDRDSRRPAYSAGFRYAALLAAQRQLDAEKCILVVDECDDMIEANGRQGFFGHFFQKESGAETKGQLNTVIDENRHTVIWICNSQQDSIAASSRRRFDYSVLFDELLPETRVHIWENCLRQHGCEGRLSREFIENVSRKYKVNAGGIANAVKNAKALVAKHPEKPFDECVTTFLGAHCTLLGIRKSNDERLEPSRDYSLEGLNIKSGIRPERIIQVCDNFLNAQANPALAGRDRPRMNLLLHGAPGSGKTEFVKYLAKRLGRKLNIKNASDLLSCWVGGTEQLLAAAFAEAEKNNEILFIDEGDSMLSSRDGAQRSWEVSQVNTLLTEMENFSGIFAVSTNLIQRLDPAALRRFTFRIHFDFLDDNGKDIFFRTYFSHLNLPEMTKEERNALHAIGRLTPSDFRNVRQQLFYLSETEKVTNSEIIDALRLESQSRSSQGEFKGIGEERHSIGFDA